MTLLDSGVEVALLSMQPHRFIQVQGKKAPGLRWPQVMDHEQLGFSLKGLSLKQGNAGFGRKKMETLETFRRAKEHRAKKPFPEVLVTAGGTSTNTCAGREVWTFLGLMSFSQH